MTYPPQGPGPYGQRLPYRPQAPRKTHPLLIGCGVLGGIFLLLIVIGVIASATKKTPSASPVAPPVVSATSTRPAAKTQQTTKAAAPAQPVTVLTEHGNGIKSTASFTVHDDWDLTYSFDCSNFGGQGNFAVTINGSAGDVLVNELAAKGSDTTHQHDGPGKIALDVNSECAWTIKVIQLP